MSTPSRPLPTADELRIRAAELRRAIERKRKAIHEALTSTGIDRLFDERRDLEAELGAVLKSLPGAVAREGKAS